MLKYTRELRHILRYNAVCKVNHLIYIARRLPLIGKSLGDQYHFSRLKAFACRISPLLIILSKLAGSIVGLALFISFSEFLAKLIAPIHLDLLGDSTPIYSFSRHATLILLHYVVYIGFKDRATEASGAILEQRRCFHLSMPSLIYFHAIHMALFVTVGRTIAFILYAHTFAGMSVAEAMMLNVVLLLLEWSRLRANLDYFIRHNKQLSDTKRILPILLTWLFMIAAEIYFDLNLMPYVIWLIPILLVTAIIGVRRFLAFDRYGHLQESLMVQYSSVNAAVQKALSQSTHLEAKDYKKISSDKTGYAYLNELFFNRHSRLIRKPIYIRTGIVAVVCLAGFIFIPAQVFQNAKLKDDILRLAFYLPFVMYFLCNQENLTQAFYMNCDKSLLRYSFYHRAEVLLKMFRLRLFSIFKLMAPATLMLCSFFLAMGLRYSFGLNTLWIILITLLYGIFFMMFPLFLYYVFQPYNSSGQIGKPIVGIIKVALYMSCFFVLPNLGGRIDARLFTLLSAAGLSLFILLSYILILKHAAKTMRA